MLRPYQVELRGKLVEWFGSRKTRAYFQQATGLGKTFLLIKFALELVEQGKHVLILIPTLDLMQQYAQRIYDEGYKEVMGHFSSIWRIRGPNGKAISRQYQIKPLMLSTYASLRSNKSQDALAEAGIDLIIADECHHAYTKATQNAFERFAESKILACSATPDYFSGRRQRKAELVELENGFSLYAQTDRMAKTYFGEGLDQRSLKWGASNGFLCPLVWGQINLNLNLEQATITKTQYGEDFSLSSLQTLMRKRWGMLCDAVVGLYQSPTSKYDLRGHNAIAVCPSVDMAIELAKRMNQAGLRAAAIYGSMPIRERRSLRSSFESGELDMLTSVHLLREGWDMPSADICFMLRPTMSYVYFVQTIGRILRKDPSNPHKVAMVVDIYQSHAKLHPFYLPTILGLQGEKIDVSQVLIGQALTEGKKQNPYLKLSLPDQVTSELIVIPEACSAGRREYYTYEEAKEVVQRLRIQGVTDYSERYKKDPKLPSSPWQFYGEEYEGSYVFFAKYYLYEEAKEVVQRLGIRSQREYLERYKVDPKLPSNPWIFYEEYQGADFFRKYYTYAEAKEAVQRLGIQAHDEYNKRYKVDPRLSADPRTFYGEEYEGAKIFFGKHYTYAEAKEAVQSLGIRSQGEYKKRSKVDPRLPADPRTFYGEEYEGAYVFFAKYYSYEEAKEVVQRLGIRSHREYHEHYKVDPRLPSTPGIFYGEDYEGWTVFSGKYYSYEEAKEVVQKLGIRTCDEYKERYKKDPKLPSKPNNTYSEQWLGWPKFLGKE